MAQPSKILYIITQSEWGGAQRYIFDLATNLPKDQYEVSVAAGGSEELFEKLDSVAIKTFQLKYLIREISPIQDYLAILEIRKLIKRIQPNIIHLNSSKAGIVGSLAAIGLKTRVIYTIHGFVFNEPMPAWKKYFYILAEKFTARFKEKLICVSEFDRQAGIKNKITSQKKFVTINNAVGPINFLSQEIAREKLGLPADKIIIGTIANFYPTKGLNYLIAAAKIIIDQRPEIFFQLIGFGQLENDLRTLVKESNIAANFTIFNGKNMNGDGKIYLKAFDFYTLPSVKEGFPYAILEAMQAGLPIVATNVGGLPEMINNNVNGLLVKPADPAELAQALISLLNDKNLAQQFGRQAKIDFENKFSLEKMIAATEKIYLG